MCEHAAYVLLLCVVDFQIVDVKVYHYCKLSTYNSLGITCISSAAIYIKQVLYLSTPMALTNVAKSIKKCMFKVDLEWELIINHD